MSDEPGTGDGAAGNEDSAAPGESAPWERPRRWNQQRLEPARVDDLLARLSPESDASEGRRRRRRDGEPEQSVAASELIAALTPPAGTAAQPSTDPADGATVLLPPGAADAAAPTTVLPQPEPTVPLLTHPTAPPRVQAPVQDLGEVEGHTDVIPKVAVPDQHARSIRESLRRSSPAAVAAGALPSAATGPTGNPPPPPGNSGPGGGGPPGDGRPPHRHRGWLFAGRAAIAMVAVVLLCVMGLEWQIKANATQGLIDRQVSAVNTSDSNIVKPRSTVISRTTISGSEVVVTNEQPPPTTYKSENILLLGSDTRAGANGDDTNSNGQQQSAQSDVLMIAHISADRQHVTVLSIPRDTMIAAPTCKSWDYLTGKYSDQNVQVDPGQRFHITNAYAVGGPKCTVNAVQQMTGLRIDRMIGIDFIGFRSMVDALGGITVNICRPMTDAELGVVADKSGVQTIGGQQALGLVRARNVLSDNGLSDLARIRRQQIVLSSILRQVNTAGTLLNPARLNRFLQAFVRNTFTDNVDLNSLVDLAGSLGDLSPGKVTFYTLPTVPDQENEGAVDPDPSKAPAVYDALINDLTLPGEAPTTSTKTTSTRSSTTTSATTSSSTSAPTTASSTTPPDLTISVSPGSVQLQVYNVTGQAGVGTTVQSNLNDAGFNVVDDDVFRPEGESQSEVTVVYSGGNRDAALTVAAAVPGSVLVERAGLGKTVQLRVGSDFAGDISTVSVGQTVPESLAPTGTSTSETTSSSTSATTATTSSTASTPSTSRNPATTLKSTDLESVNAGSGLCA